MKKLATAIAILALGFMWTPGADAQITDVTVRDINYVHPDSIAALNAAGASMTSEELFRRMVDTGPIQVGDTVRVVVVVLSDPLLSGLASPDNDGVPGRIHIFVRDTSSVSLGNEGMGTQIVDNNFQNSGSSGLHVGDVVQLVATVNTFLATVQIEPVSLEVIGGIEDFGLPATIMDPVVVSTSDVNMSVGSNGEIQPNWDRIVDMQGQYVRFENVTLTLRDISTDRPSWYISHDGNTTGLVSRDISLMYRNDRGNYSDDFRKPDDDFVPPPPGSLLNVEGFLATYDFQPFGSIGPAPWSHFIAPMERSDIETLESPPIISSITDPDVPDTNPVSVTADVVPDDERTLTSVSLHYYTSSATDTSTVAAGAPTGINYPFEIPGVADGEFVTYWIEAEDSEAATTRSADQVYRALADGIDSISDIQTTASGGVGASPFSGSTVDMNINAFVQTDGAATGIWAIQDDVNLDPWSGIQINSLKSGQTAPSLGDDVTITRALVRENFDLTQLDSVEVTINGAGTPYPHKVVSTVTLADLDIAEAHEGMLLRFEDVTIISEDEGFGEWSFSSDGTEDNLLKADDSSSQISSSFAVDTFNDGDDVEFIQGVLSFSFSEYKLLPLTTADIGTVTDVERVVAADGFVLHQNFPNPFAESTSITLTTPTPGDVRLAVYDVLGRHVRTLIDGPVPAGDHTVEFDRSELASGLYMYRLEANANSLVRTMTIVR